MPPRELHSASVVEQQQTRRNRAGDNNVVVDVVAGGGGAGTMSRIHNDDESASAAGEVAPLVIHHSTTLTIHSAAHRHQNGHGDDGQTKKKNGCVINNGYGATATTTNDEEQQQQQHLPLSKKNGDDDEDDIERSSYWVQHKKKRRRSSHVNLWYDELKHMITLAVPIIGTYLLEMLPGVISIILVGHIHPSGTSDDADEKMVERYIDAASLSVMFLNLVGLSTGIGLASAMDTLCSQAYGAGNIEQMGTHLQTGLLVLSVNYIVVIIVGYYYTSEILLFLGQPREVSELAGYFTKYLLPGIPFLYLYELLRKVLQAQNIAMPMLYVALGGNLINGIVGYYLVYHTSLGFIGAAIARTISYISFPLLLLPYLYLSSSKSSSKFWTGLHIRQAYENIGQFLNLGISGMLQLCFEWWAFEILAIISGWLPNAIPSIGANSLILNISSMVYMFYLGISIAVNVRIGNALGGDQPKRAAVSAELGLGLSIACSVFCAAILLVFRKQLPKLFTHDEEIRQLTEHILYVSAAFQIVDSMNAAIQGTFRGSGRQHLGAMLNFVAYYVIGIPLGSLLAFGFGGHLFGVDWGLMGLWVGMTFSLAVVAMGGTTIIVRSDWSKLAKEAQDRVASGE